MGYQKGDGVSDRGMEYQIAVGYQIGRLGYQMGMTRYQMGDEVPERGMGYQIGAPPPANLTPAPIWPTQPPSGPHSCVAPPLPSICPSSPIWPHSMLPSGRRSCLASSNTPNLASSYLAPPTALPSVNCFHLVVPFLAALTSDPHLAWMGYPNVHFNLTSHRLRPHHVLPL